MFEGSMVPIITPFKGGKVDYKALADLIEWHLDQGTHAIVPCGTTGESSTLDFDEHIKVVERTVAVVKKRVPVIAGTGANATKEAVELTVRSRKAGADGALMVTPYYNKPTQEGLFLHYKKVVDSVKGFPIVLYNVPGRTGMNMAPATVARLARAFKSIVGVKEASGNLKQVSDLVRLCPEGFSVISGDDFTNLALYALGGKGTISVTANVAPKMVSQMWEYYKTGDLRKAREMHFKLEPLNEAMFIETNPIPVKTAVAMMGKVKEEFRLPLCPMAEANRAKLKDVLKKYKLVR